jgi:signal transduction histidine kinase
VLDGSRAVQALAAERGVTLVTTLSEVADEPLLVLGDRRLIETMLENLLRHAIHVTPCGARVDVRVELDGDGRQVVLRVRDQGPRVAPEHLHAIFDWFFKTPVDQRLAGGTCFGLAVAKRLAEHHGGAIAAANVGADGLEVTVRLERWPGATGPRETEPGVRGGE